MGNLKRVVALAMAAGVAAVFMPSPTRAADLGTRVVIYRDEYGVPHVYSDTVRGLAEGAGYATAQDRLFQADLVRRTGSGTLSELLGPGTGNSNVASDEFFRLFTGGASHRAVLYASLPTRDQEILTGFRDGMNRWIAEAIKTGKLPVEYTFLFTKPRPWTTDDIVATAMLSIYVFGSNGMDELANAAQLAALTTRLGSSEAGLVFQDAHWVNDPTAPTTIPAADQTRAQGGPFSGPRALPPRSEVVDASAVARAQATLSGAASVLARLGLIGIGHSNAIAISGELSRDRSPLLLGGPQIGYSVPQGFMEIGLHGAGFDATGVTLAGNPGVDIGAGNGHAWTVTSGGDKNEDWYAEVTDPSHHPGQYFFDGAWHPFDCHTETIKVSGHPSVPLKACFTVHGPVLGSSASTALTLRDATRENLAGSVDGFFGLDQAKTMNDFFAAGSKIVGSLNLTYADQAGNIAYAHVGSVPIRPVNDNPFLPHPGDGSDEWQGYIPTAQLPFVANPEQGWLANWNNKPEAGWINASSGFWDWGPVQRVQVIRRQLEDLEPHSATLATLERINMTTGETTESPVGVESNMFVQKLLPAMLDKVESSADSRIPGILSLLDNWNQLRVDTDKDNDYDSPAVTVFDAWYATLVSEVFAPKTGARGTASAIDDNTIADMALRLYQGGDAGLPLHGNYLGNDSRSQATTKALVDALNQLTKQYGTPDVSRWLTRVVMIHYTPQGAGSVPDIPWMNRGTYNQILHVGQGGALFGENVVAPGQSGDPFSAHFKDQLALYAGWKYKPMRLTLSDLNGHISATTIFFVS